MKVKEKMERRLDNERCEKIQEKNGNDGKKRKKHRGNDETRYRENKKGIRRGGAGGRKEESWMVKRGM